MLPNRDLIEHSWDVMEPQTELRLGSKTLVTGKLEAALHLDIILCNFKLVTNQSVLR